MKDCQEALNFRREDNNKKETNPVWSEEKSIQRVIKKKLNWTV